MNIDFSMCYHCGCVKEENPTVIFKKTDVLEMPVLCYDCLSINCDKCKLKAIKSLKYGCKRLST